MNTPKPETLHYLDQCVDGDGIHEWYRVQDSNVLVSMAGPYGTELELVTHTGEPLAAPTLAARAELYGKCRNAQSARELAEWIRTNVKELDE